MHWPEMPIVKFVLPLMAGIALSARLEMPLLPLLGACGLGFALLVALHLRARAWHQRRAFGGALLVVGALVGITLQHLQQRPPLQPAEDGEAYVGEVLQCFPSRSSWQRLRVAVQYQLQTGGYWTRACGRLEVFAQGDSLAEALRPGDRLLFAAAIRPVATSGNPEAFDYGAYLARQRIFHQAFLRGGDWQLLENKDRFHWRRSLHQLRTRALTRLRQALPDAASYGLAAALLLGSKGQLPQELKESYAEVGVAHVLAVSGLHVGILAFGLLFLLNRLPLRPRWRRPLALYASLFALALYALLTGLPASVQRTSLMYGIVLIGRFTRLKGNSFNSLGVAALLMLCADASLLYDLGFQYSFLALFGILFFHPPLAGAVLVVQPWLKKLWDLTVLGIAANLTTFPLTLYYFHDFPVYFWLSSLFITFLVTLILYGGFLFLLLGGVPVLGWLLAKSLAVLLGLSNALVHGLTRLPGHTIAGVWLDTADLLLLYGAIAALVWTLSRRRKAGLYLSLACLLLVALKGVYRAAQAGQQRELVLYRLEPGQTALDLFEGRRVYGLIRGGLEARALDYARENYRIKRRIREQRELVLPDAELLTGSIRLKDGFIQFGSLEIAILGELSGSPPDAPLPVDVLIWTGRSCPEAVDLKRWMEPGWIALDGSLPRWTAERCRAAWAGQNWNLHNVPHEGAFILSIPKP
jgi:competence protein ComEC